jgi:transcription-repair coupling factor (superfamily II helicase)
MERLLLKNKRCICYFIADQESNFFQTPNFSHILTKVQENQDRMILKEKNTGQGLKLLLSLNNVKDVTSVKKILETLILPTTTSNS